MLQVFLAIRYKSKGQSKYNQNKTKNQAQRDLVVLDSQEWPGREI